MADYDILFPGRKGPFADDARIEGANTDNFGSALVAEAGPKYLEWLRRGWMYTAPSNTALAIPIFSTPTNAPTLWNPATSGKVVLVTRLSLALCAGATIPDSGYGLLMSYGVGSPPAAAGQYFSAFTALATMFNLKSGANDGQAKMGVVATWTAIPTTTRWVGKSQFTLGTAASAGFGDTFIDLDTSAPILLMPGMAVSIVASLASATTFMPSFDYAELDARFFQ